MNAKNVNAIAILVRDYDEAIQWFSEKLGFELVEDTKISDQKRWVKMALGSGAQLLLAKAASDAQTQFIGNQAGGRVFLFLETPDFWAEYNLMNDKGVVFEETPREEPYGTVAVFKDLYGNRWDLLETKPKLKI